MGHPATLLNMSQSGLVMVESPILIPGLAIPRIYIQRECLGHHERQVERQGHLITPQAVGYNPGHLGQFRPQTPSQYCSLHASSLSDGQKSPWLANKVLIFSKHYLRGWGVWHVRSQLYP